MTTFQSETTLAGYTLLFSFDSVHTLFISRRSNKRRVTFTGPHGHCGCNCRNGFPIEDPLTSGRSVVKLYCESRRVVSFALDYRQLAGFLAVTQTFIDPGAVSIKGFILRKQLTIITHGTSISLANYYYNNILNFHSNFNFFSLQTKTKLVFLFLFFSSTVNNFQTLFRSFFYLKKK